MEPSACRVAGGLGGVQQVDQPQHHFAHRVAHGFDGLGGVQQVDKCEQPRSQLDLAHACNDMVSNQH